MLTHKHDLQLGCRGEEIAWVAGVRFHVANLHHVLQRKLVSPEEAVECFTLLTESGVQPNHGVWIRIRDDFPEIASLRPELYNTAHKEIFLDATNRRKNIRLQDVANNLKNWSGSYVATPSAVVLLLTHLGRTLLSGKPLSLLALSLLKKSSQSSAPKHYSESTGHFPESRL